MIISGGLIISFAYMFRNFEGIAEACTAVMSVLGGPTMGLFTLGIFFPFVFQHAGLIGILTGLGISTWKYIGAFYYPPGLKWTRPLSLNISKCSNRTEEQITNSSQFPNFKGHQEMSSIEDSSGVYGFYHTSYCYLGSIGFFTTLTVAICISIVVNKIQTGNCFIAKETAPDGTTWLTRRRSKKEYGFNGNDVPSDETSDCKENETYKEDILESLL